jgi:elongation factor Ts
MAEITALMVKDLRLKTGAGMADCKKALEENDGNPELAIEYLRKKGAAAAAKRGDRITNEGYIAAKAINNGSSVVLVGVTCETDFVARNQDFIDYVESVFEVMTKNSPATIEELFKLSLGNDTVEAAHNSILAKFSEKIDIAKFTNTSTTGSYTVYIHGGNKLAVILELSTPLTEDFQVALGKDIAMQIAAMNPQYVDRSQVQTEVLDKEKEIFMEQAIAEGKKPEIAEKIAGGRVEKFYKENCLVEQSFVKDNTKSVTDVLNQIAPGTKVLSFIRYAIGE